MVVSPDRQGKLRERERERASSRSEEGLLLCILYSQLQLYPVIVVVSQCTYPEAWVEKLILEKKKEQLFDRM